MEKEANEREGKERRKTVLGGQAVRQLWALQLIIICIHRFPYLCLLSHSEGVDSQLPCPLNRSLMSSGFLFNIKTKDKEDERERVRVIVLMACNRLFLELEGTNL